MEASAAARLAASRCSTGFPVITPRVDLRDQPISSGNPSFELYNIKEDPFEKNDLAVKYPGKVKKMTKKIDKVRTQSELFNFGIKAGK